MRVFAIGDVQGCARSLDELLRFIQFEPDSDRLWFAGDLVNRGPDSLSVLRTVKALGDSAVSVLGNHDLHLLALAHGNRQKDKANPGLQNVLDAWDGDDLLHWLRHRPMMHHDQELGFTLLHAGLPPEWDLDMAKKAARNLEAALRGPEHPHFFASMYGNKPDRWDKSLAGMDLLRYTTNCLTRMRFVSVDGRLDYRQKGPPHSAPVELIPWFKHPQRRSQNERIVCGHWSTLGYNEHEKVYSIDTGCLWGGELTALQIHPRIERFSLPCPKTV